MAHDVFISHSSKDKTIADAVCARLEARGIRCWIAPRDVQPGLPYGEAIIDAIHICKIMVLLLSSNANNSIHIAKEVERAVSHGATVIPLRIEAVMPAKSLDYFIGSVHWLDALTPPLESHLDNLAQTILKILPPRDIPGAPEIPPPVAAPRVVTPPVSPVASFPSATIPSPSTVTPTAEKKSWLIPAVIGGVVLIIAIVGLVVMLMSGSSDKPGTGSFASGSPSGNAGGDAAPVPKRSGGGSSAGSDAVVGCWQWFNNAAVIIRSNGLMNAGPFTAEWRSVDPSRRTFNFVWPEAVDTATLSLDGRSLSGGNQYGYKMSATRLSGGPGLSGTWRWYNGVVVAIQPDGSFIAGNVSGRWRGSGLSYSLTWPKPVDSVTLSADHNRIDGHNQYGIHISGTRTGGCGV